MWIASTPARPWVQQGRPVAATRKADINLHLDGSLLQLWEGFGGGMSELGWEAMALLRGVDRLRVLQALFNHDDGCRFHYARTPIGASNLAVGPYSLNDHSGDLPMKQFSVARDQQRLIPFLRYPLERIRKFKVVACPWSPPAWMKEPPEGRAGRIVWNPVMLEAYALYLARYIEEYRSAGIPVDHLMVQNEPGEVGRQPGCLWTGAHLRDFIRNYLGPTLNKRRITAKLWLGALGSAGYEEGALTILSDPLVRPMLHGVACQRGARELLPRIQRAFADIPLMQSDCGEGTGENSWEQGHATFSAILQALSCGACLCLYENMVFLSGGRDAEGQGRNSLVAVDGASKSYTLTPDYHVLRHFSALTDRWAVRLGLTGEWADRAAAFYNENDESRVLVIHNPEPESRRVFLDDRGRRQVMVLPANSFNTLVL